MCSSQELILRRECYETSRWEAMDIEAPQGVRTLNFSPLLQRPPPTVVCPVSARMRTPTVGRLTAIIQELLPASVRLSAQKDRNSSWNTEGRAPTANLAAWTEVPLRAVSRINYRNFEVRETQTFQPSGVALCVGVSPWGYLCPGQCRKTPL